ncbi:MAG: hypothetical protein V1870_01790 [Candidatus Aenigmatarchaeota archaeon]
MEETKEEYYKENFELVPISPLRGMQKRMDQLEHDMVSHKDLKEMYNIIKANQTAVDEIVRLNKSMLQQVSELSNAASNITMKMSDFLSRIEVEELPPAKELRGVTDFNERITKMENRLNSLILALNPRVRKPVAHARPMHRPVAI